MEAPPLENTTTTNMSFNFQCKVYLAETAKWAKMLSIVGFMMAGLLILAGIFVGSVLSFLGPQFGGVPNLPVGYIAVFYLAFGVIYIIPLLYLYRFATKAQIALRTEDETALTNSFKNLKSLFKFSGIMTIIVLVIYAISAVFGIAMKTYFGL